MFDSFKGGWLLQEDDSDYLFQGAVVRYGISTSRRLDPSINSMELRDTGCGAGGSAGGNTALFTTG